MIKITNLTHKYKTKTITYKDYTFNQFEITFITGKNGTGKTTLLKLLAGLLDNPFTHNYQTTYSSQTPVLFDMTVYDNITFPLNVRNYNLEDYKETIIHYTKLLEIDHLLDKNPKTLSSGERMKVAIIRSIIFNPDIVLLDEPTTSLDVTSIEELTKLLKQLKTKITFIIVSHDRLFIDDLKDNLYELGE
jgi:ABC-type sugar transport system ATPase subunit